MKVFGLWEGARVPGEKQERCVESKQTPLAPSGDSNMLTYAFLIDSFWLNSDCLE